MRVALLISGYLRTFKFNFNNLQERIIKRFDNVDVYIHLTLDENLSDRYLNIHNVEEDISFIRNNLNPMCLITEANLNISTDNKENNTINTWLKYFKLNQIKQDNEKEFGIYDMVIKYRPDLNIFSDELFIDDLTKDIVYIPLDAKIDIQKLKNPSDRYLCDVLAYGNSISMDKYFNIYLTIKNLINKYGNSSETLLFHYCLQNNIQYKLINVDYGIFLSSCNVFAICGDSGSGKTTLSNILLQYFSNSFLLECDRYHKWERGNDNWEKITHLNPDANYITKIKEDIFSLKLGKSIYQVNYNHDNGKFTNPEEIKPSNNLIVCGLHSLYGNNDCLYDFKVFIDTDDLLKNKWKINRDVMERGHEVSSIIKQIENRRDDFNKFIYPQRIKSDIIVNFFINDQDEIALRLHINKKYNILSLFIKLNDKNIKYSVIDDGIFTSITFNKYIKSDLWNNEKMPIRGDFYDYILFFIFNIKK